MAGRTARAGVSIGFMLLLAACAAMSQRAERVEEVAVPVDPGVDAPPIHATGRTEGPCGGEGGCVYLGKLNGHIEGFRYEVDWEFEQNVEGRLTVPDDIELPVAARGWHLIQLHALQASDMIVNDERELEAAVARCDARFAAAAGDAEIHIEVTFTFDTTGEGTCPIARLGVPMEPAATRAPTPSR